MNLQEFMSYQQSKGHWNLEDEIFGYFTEVLERLETVSEFIGTVPEISTQITFINNLRTTFNNKSEGYLDKILDHLKDSRAVIDNPILTERFCTSVEIEKARILLDSHIESIYLLKQLEEENKTALFVVGEELFESEAEALEYCRKNIIKIV